MYVDVKELQSARSADTRGLDDTNLTLLPALLSIQQAWMDNAHGLLCDDAKKILVQGIPDLKGIVSEQYARWMDAQKKKMQLLCDRCLELDEWQAVDRAAKHNMSSSVGDYFKVIHTLNDTFWQYITVTTFPFGSACIEQWIKLLSDSIENYANRLLSTCHLHNVSDMRPSTNVKLKQAKQSANDTDKAKMVLKNVFGKNQPGSNAVSISYHIGIMYIVALCSCFDRVLMYVLNAAYGV